MSTESLPGAIWTEDASAGRPASAFVTPAPAPAPGANWVTETGEFMVTETGEDWVL